MAVRIIGCLVFWQTRDPRSRRPLSHFGRCWQNSSRKSILCGSFGFCQVLSTMGRPAKTLLERVLAGSFRADRYGSLLAGKLLPKTSPFSDPFRRRIWQDLREAQQEYQEAPGGLRPGLLQVRPGTPRRQAAFLDAGEADETPGFIAAGWSGSWRNFRRGELCPPGRWATGRSPSRALMRLNSLGTPASIF